MLRKSDEEMHMIKHHYVTPDGNVIALVCSDTKRTIFVMDFSSRQ